MFECAEIQKWTTIKELTSQLASCSVSYTLVGYHLHPVSVINCSPSDHKYNVTLHTDHLLEIVQNNTVAQCIL